MRRLWIALGSLAVLLILGVLGLNLWVNAYLRSAAFRQLVTAKTGQALRADIDCQPLEWSGASVYSAEFTGQGAPGSPLEAITAEQVRANVNWRAIFNGAWRLDRVDVVRLDAKLRTAPERAATTREPGPKPDAAPPKKGWLPNRFELGQLTVQDANASVDGVGQIQKTVLTVHPEGDGWVFDGAGGKLSLPTRKPFDIDSFRVRLQQGVVYLTDGELRLGAAGTVAMSGEFGGKDSPFDVRVNWANVDAADLLDATWAQRLTGKLSGEAHSEKNSEGGVVTRGRFLLADGQLSGLPVQREIAQFTQSPQFERMPVREISGEFKTDGRETRVKNFVAESTGLLRVEGECKIGEGGALRGEFLVGVTSQTLQWLPGSRERVFTESRNGYLWTKVKVSGTIEKPREDLSNRLAQAMGEQVISSGVEALKDAPSNATDAVQKAVELLTPLIP
jgi:hypothetical protein